MNRHDQQIYAGKICPYCDQATMLVDGGDIYGASYVGRFWMYLCKGCHAYVGTHPGTTRALGRLADAELRKWKKLAHYHFDALWRRKMCQGFTKTKARGLAYKWLSEKLNIEIERAHIGMFDVAECKAVVELCKPYSLNILRQERTNYE